MGVLLLIFCFVLDHTQSRVQATPGKVLGGGSWQFREHFLQELSSSSICQARILALSPSQEKDFMKEFMIFQKYTEVFEVNYNSRNSSGIFFGASAGSG